MSDNGSDNLLLEQLRLRQGACESAFEALFVCYYGPVYRVAYRLMADHEAAEDLVQETFLSLYNRPPRLKGDISLAVWLYRVTLNRGYNVLRGARRERERLKRVTAESSEASSAELEAAFLQAEANSIIREALGRLTERQYNLIMLHQAGFSHGEIAAILELAVGSVGTLLNRAEQAFLVAYEREKTVEMEKSGVEFPSASRTNRDAGKRRNG